MSVTKRREREKEARRNDILDAARRVFYAKGFDAAKMEDVADEAQLGKGTLYIYFRTKEDLLMGVAMQHQQRMIALFEQEQKQACDGLDLIRRMLRAYARHMSEPLEHLKMVMSRWARGEPLTEDSASAGKMLESGMRIFGMMRAAFADGQQDGSIRADVDPGQACMTMWSSVNGRLILGLQFKCIGAPNPLVEMAPSIDESIDLLLDAVRTRQSVAKAEAS